MAMKIRLARGGSKKRPFYRVVASDSRMPRDGRYVEKLGTYNPLLPKDSEERVKLNMERLEAAGVLEKKERANLKKGEPGKKAQDRVEEKAAKAQAAKEAAEEAAAAPAEEAPAEEAAAEESAE